MAIHTKISNTMTKKHVICRLHDIPDNGAKGFVIGNGPKTLEMFVIRKDNQVYAYVNRCPHTGTNLDWTPDQFLDNSGDLIQCSTHGAKFRIKNGYCVSGPCSDDHLQPINVDICDNQLQLILE